MVRILLEWLLRVAVSLLKQQIGVSGKTTGGIRRHGWRSYSEGKKIQGVEWLDLRQGPHAED